MWRSLTLAALLLPLSASAETLAILELRFDEISPALADQLRLELHQAATQHGYVVLAEERVARAQKESATAPGCVVGPCLARLASALRAERLVIGGVAAHGSSYELTLTLLESGGGMVLAQVNDRCDVCNFKEAEDSMARAMAQLHKQSLVYLASQATLTVQTTPANVEVLIDNLPSGRSPMTRLVAPGRHVVELAAKGLLGVKEEVWLEEGKTRTMRVNLFEGWRRMRAEDGRRRGPGLPPWLKWVALGTGAALAGAGAGLWSMDGRPAGDDERMLHDTRAAGITMVSVGSGVALSSLVFYLLERRGERTSGQAEVQHGR